MLGVFDGNGPKCDLSLKLSMTILPLVPFTRAVVMFIVILPALHATMVLSHCWLGMISPRSLYFLYPIYRISFRVDLVSADLN